MRNAAVHKEKKLLKMIKMAVGIEFKKIKEEAEHMEESTLNDLSKAIAGEGQSEEAFSLNDTDSQISGREREAIKATLGPKEKYLKAHDFLEVQLGNVERDLCPHTELVKLIVGLIDLVAIDKVVNICFKEEEYPSKI